MPELRVVRDIVPTGIGHPDGERKISSAIERRGIKLDYGQTLKVFGLVFTDENIGAHTAAISANVMTDAVASFTANLLVGLAIVNVTDGSSGIIIANTATTVTVVALTGGATNQWNPADIYRVLSPFSWVSSPLAAGGSAHFIDNETGLLDTYTYTIAPGYILFVIEAAHSSDEDVELWAYVDGFTYSGMGIVSAGQQVLDQRVVGFTTEVFDPTAALSHTLDVVVTNNGLGTLKGGFSLICILEAVGTPPIPKIKTVRCKHCGSKETVPQETTNHICKCGQLNRYLSLPGFRGTR